MDKAYFKSTPDNRPPFTVVIPPPNVTGVLHMGHTLNETVQDILIRKARMSGFNACWVPGSDHASIATEAKVVQMLEKEKGISKHELSREDFLKHAFEWKEKYGGIIYSQIAKLGCSARKMMAQMSWKMSKPTASRPASRPPTSVRPGTPSCRSSRPARRVSS